jgi:hypothetical protein
MLTIAGTVILRKYKTPLSIGALIGFIFVISNLCLILCAIFANVADVVEDDDVDRPYEAFATFQFFLFAVYSFFGISLSVRGIIFKQIICVCLPILFFWWSVFLSKQVC